MHTYMCMHICLDSDIDIDRDIYIYTLTLGRYWWLWARSFADYVPSTPLAPGEGVRARVIYI